MNRKNRELLLKARIKELENIICPGEQHEYVKVNEKMDVVDCFGTFVFHRRYVCKRCFNAVENTELH